MNTKGGIIYEFPDNRFGIGYYREQQAIFSDRGKVLVHVFEDRQCTKPELVDGKPYKILKSWHLLTIIGYVD